MAQSAFPEVNDYMTHQAAKGLDSLASLMQRTAVEWQRNLRDMSEEQATFAPSGEWSAKEVATHFLNTTGSVNAQIRQIAEGGDPGELGEDPSKPAVTPTVEDLCTRLATTFDDTVSLTRSLEGNDNLEKRFPHPMFGQLNILEWIAFQRVHSVDHMRQIDKNREAAGYPA